MAETKDRYPQILLSGTDSELPETFKNDYRRYSNFGPLSGGGNGVLRSCFDHGLNRWVAIKTVLPKYTKDPVERRRLIREARVTAQLQHPNTVPVYELGVNVYGDLYFTMKRIEGANLFQIIRARSASITAEKDETPSAPSQRAEKQLASRRASSRAARGPNAERIAADLAETFSLDRLLETLVQATNALEYAHTHGVIHRDVKPENILIGTYGEVYLMDWGVAFVRGMNNVADTDDLDDDILFERLTVTGKRPGTPLYMSPEQVMGDRIDKRTDVFSMGVVLYEALSAHEPFRGVDVTETFDNILHFHPVPPSTISHEPVPAELDRICLKAISKKPEDRYQSAADLVEAIRVFRERALAASENVENVENAASAESAESKGRTKQD